ncbi:hypothetical protein [Nesterenkonia pannonica]|uniref:hypothetical protein n=1 Tax=Nesterenkonia pannonica TaxID=1548602 RepID=UPI00216431CC|nr:hypothetical protein [Nesterenkonia pannonica]
MTVADGLKDSGNIVRIHQQLNGGRRLCAEGRLARPDVCELRRGHESGHLPILAVASAADPQTSAALPR